MPCGIRTDERRWCDEGPRPSGLKPGDGGPARRGSVSTPGQERLKSGAHITLVSGLNHAHLQRSEDDAQVEGTVPSYELASAIQSAAPSVLELAGESEATRKLYGIGTPETDDFGRQCLLARRFAESGVRFIQISTAYLWDQHERLVSGHEK